MRLLQKWWGTGENPYVSPCSTTVVEKESETPNTSKYLDRYAKEVTSVSEKVKALAPAFDLRKGPLEGDQLDAIIRIAWHMGQLHTRLLQLHGSITLTMKHTGNMDAARAEEALELVDATKRKIEDLIEPPQISSTHPPLPS